MRRAAFILLLALLAGCQRGGDAPAASSAPRIDGERIVFAPESPQRQALRSVSPAGLASETLRLNGRVVWDETRTVRVFAPLAGRVEKLVAEPGRQVSAGDMLAAIASPDFGQTQSEAARARADLAVADKALARARELHAHGVTAEKDLQLAEADFARAEAEERRTSARARLYGGGPAVDQRFVLRAPISGIVVERNVNPGQEVRADQAQPGSPALFVISDPSRMWVQIELPEAALADVRQGMEFRLRSPALGDAPLAGRVDWVADSVDPLTRTTRARGSIANADRRLKAEMFVTAEVDVARGPSLSVPTVAVILLGADRYVFIDRGDGSYQRRRIVAEEAGFGLVRIREGLTKDERVVTDGALLLQQILAAGA